MSNNRGQYLRLVFNSGPITIHLYQYACSDKTAYRIDARQGKYASTEMLNQLRLAIEKELVAVGKLKSSKARMNKYLEKHRPDHNKRSLDYYYKNRSTVNQKTAERQRKKRELSKQQNVCSL